MDLNKINTWIAENKIDDITNLALSLPKKDYDLFIADLIQRLETTTDNNYRNTIAIVLGDLHCDKAIDSLIKLINNPKLVNSRGTLIYALENLNVSDRLDSFIELLVYGNYEVKCNTYTLFEKHITNMTEEKKSIYVEMLKEKISDMEESLELMYELCSTVFDVEVE